MPATQPSKDLRPLCHEHLLEMRLNRSFLNNGDEMDMLPKVRCFLDGMPMYLAEIHPEKTSFRLWTCPQCGARRTNEEDLVGLASQETQDLGGENKAQSEPTGTRHI